MEANSVNQRIRNSQSLRNISPIQTTNSYSLTSVLKKLAILTYEWKSIQEQNVYSLPAQKLQGMETKLGNCMFIFFLI